MPKKVGRCRLPLLLHMARITQKELSSLTGITHQQLSDYCNNRKVMSYSNAKKISKALQDKVTFQVTMEDLYEE